MKQSFQHLKKIKCDARFFVFTELTGVSLNVCGYPEKIESDPRRRASSHSSLTKVL